jgi:threonine dehydratase
MRAMPIPGAIDRTALPGADTLEPARHFAETYAAFDVRAADVARAPALDRLADPSGATRVWLAHEHRQVTGSFKVRGALHAIAARKRAGATAVVAASAGNHGAGVAYAAKALGVSATVVVPHTAPQVKRAKIEGYGANIVLSKSPHYDGAEAEAISLSRENKTPFLSPYDDVDVVVGNGASLGFEIVRALGGVPARVLAPFGGGGLATGIAWALAAEAAARANADPNADTSARDGRRVWGAQTEASPSMLLSLERNAAVTTFEGPPTLAEGLEGGISVDAFARARAVVAGMLAIDEDAIARAMRFAQAELGVTIEGSAAVALAPLLTGLPRLLLLQNETPSSSSSDLVVVLTGRNVDPGRVAT